MQNYVQIVILNPGSFLAYLIKNLSLWYQFFFSALNYVGIITNSPTRLYVHNNQRHLQLSVAETQIIYLSLSLENKVLPEYAVSLHIFEGSCENI